MFPGRGDVELRERRRDARGGRARHHHHEVGVAREHVDESISNIIKQFKLSCSKTRAQLEVHRSMVSTIFDEEIALRILDILTFLVY
jgi:predicted XRE-type DNA-binding protein